MIKLFRTMYIMCAYAHARVREKFAYKQYDVLSYLNDKIYRRL